MRQRTVGLVVGAILGTVLGFGLGLTVYPVLFPAHGSGRSESPVASGPPVAEGTFTHANPRDPAHYGAGSVSLAPGLAQLGADFEVGPGPGYRLYLVPLAEIGPDTRVDETMFIDLGPLEAFSGAQGYAIPAGLDLASYPSVVVWSTHFNVLISAAALRPVQGSR
jgi:Electron transfer DM13